MSTLFKRVFRRNKSNNLFTDAEHKDLEKKYNFFVNRALKEASTPAPIADLYDSMGAPDIRLPRTGLSMFHYYSILANSVVLRTILLKLKQEIFRETLKQGFKFTPKFKLKCRKCPAIFKETVKSCSYCGSTELIRPSELQKELWITETKRVNNAEQSLLTVMQQTEDDVNTFDDAYIILLKEYIVDKKGVIIASKVKEIMRGDPALFRIVSDSSGRRGGLYYVCPIHRTKYNEQDVQNGSCAVSGCNAVLRDVYYVETLGGGKDPHEYYIEGEVIHFSKYSPTRIYGLSPVYTLYILIRTLSLMDWYVSQLYEKGRMKGILAIAAENNDELQKWWDEQQTKLRQDPHYIPIIGMSSSNDKKGAIAFVKMIDSLREMEYLPAKEMMRNQIGAMYGVMPLFQADLSNSGGLNNEGLQIKVTDRTVDFGQSIYHNIVLPTIAQELHITDWTIELQSSREQDEMAEKQRFSLDIQNAQGMLDMGFDVKLQDDTFVFSGEAKPRDESTGFSFENLGGFLDQGSQQALPEAEGVPCPSGKHRHDEHKRCHDIGSEHTKSITKSDNYLLVNCKESTFQKELQEAQDPNHKMFWTLNKVKLIGNLPEANKLFFKTEKGQRGYFETKGFGMENYKGKNQEVVYFKRKFTASQDIQNDLVNINKMGDSIAHIICLRRKMKRAGIPEPEFNKKDDLFLSWWKWEQKMKKKDPNFRKISNQCNKAGNIGSKPDVDYPDPPKDYPEEKKKAVDIEVFHMIRNQDESGVSGTGHVATGIVWPNQSVTLRWNTDSPTITIFESFEDFKRVHVDNHPKNETEFKWLTIEDETAKMLNIITLNKSDLNEDYLKEIIPLLPLIKESGTKALAARDKIESSISKTLIALFEKGLITNLGKVKDANKKQLGKTVDALVKKITDKLEMLTFAKMLQAYRKGKHLTKEIEKQDIDWNALPFSKDDIAVLQTIYRDSPFWDSFSNMSQSLSDKLKETITNSYMAPTEAKFKEALRAVKTKFPTKPLKAQMLIAYGRVGKFSLAQTIKEFQKIVETESYHIERIVRTETTAVTNKAREITFEVEDPEEENLYDWFGPLDNRTTDQCKTIQRTVKQEGQGKGVSIDRLKEIQKEVVADFNQKNNTNWQYRDWVPHANCRRVLRRVQ